MTAAIIKIYFLFLSVNQLTASNNTDFCQLSCAGEYNTVCERKNLDCGLAPACGGHAKEIAIDRNYITNLHNFYRNKVAVGNETSNRQPPAANMNAVSYNTELEYVVQCWTNACSFTHDSCRRTRKYQYVGQNLAIKYSNSSSEDIKSVIADLVKNWYNEVIIFPPSEVERFFGGPAGHYTQMVWADTKEIGCAMTYYKKGSWNNYLLGCNYGPAGNFIGRPVYKIGKPASQCQSHTRHSQYEGLCLI